MKRAKNSRWAYTPPGHPSQQRPKGCNPIRQGSDEYRCTTCGKVWDTHEPKPNCERD